VRRDGKDQLHYVAGGDAKATYATRLQMGDEAFRKAMAERFFGAGTQEGASRSPSADRCRRSSTPRKPRISRRSAAVSATARLFETKGEPSRGPTPSTLDERGQGLTVVTARLAGAFPNSPPNLQHRFVVEGGKIVSLEIR
jgi:hypothetical protein